MSEETPEITDVLTDSVSDVVLIPQPHGGALRPRGKIGHKGGPGRPKDEVRAKLAKLANGKGMSFLKSLMEGEIVVRLTGKCEKCGKEGQPLDGDEYESLIERIRASVDQRLKGNEQALRYGIGTKDEVDVKSHPDVQRFVAQVAQATRELFGDEGYQRIAARVLELGD